MKNMRDYSKNIFSFFLVLWAVGNALLVGAQNLEEEQLTITIKDAIKIAVEKNLSLKFQAMEPEIKKSEIEVGESDFDPTLFTGIYFLKDIRPSASAFADPDVAINFERTWNLGIRQKLKLGTEYELTLQSTRDKSNSKYAGLDPQYSTELTFNFTQPLLKGFGIDINTSQILIAKNNKDISEADFRQLLIDTISNVQNAYWDLVYAKENLKVQEESLKLAQDFEKRVKAQVRVGIMAPIEILQAQAEVAAREEDIIMAQNSLEKASDVLKEIMNMKEDLYDWGGLLQPLDEPAFSGKIPNLKKKIAKALELRPDIQKTRLDLKNENINLKYNENQLYPTLDLVASLGLNGISGVAKTVGFGGNASKSKFGGGYGKDFDRMMWTDFHTWQVGINVEYPLGNRRAKNELSVSKLRIKKWLFQLKDLEKKISLQVRDGKREIETNIKRVESTRISRKLAEEKLEAEVKKFEAGLSTSFNVLSYQKDLTEQETREIQALIDYNRSLVNFHQVVAETLEVHHITVR